MSLTPDLIERLETVSTATITTLLLKAGLRHCFLRGPKPLGQEARRLVGAAFTLRFVPAREDLATPESWSSPRSTRAAIEEMPHGAIAVVDAMGVTDCGIFGDILCARMQKRGVRALVTDGAVRDLAGIEQCGLPVWCQDVAAPASVAGLTFVDWQVPIGCGGVAVFPGDCIVADRDGVVLIPASHVAMVAEAGPNQERFEAWVLRQVEAGMPLPGLYPPNAQTKERYEREIAGSA
jgi:regulator of RNase E activity RraA